MKINFLYIILSLALVSCNATTDKKTSVEKTTKTIVKDTVIQKVNTQKNEPKQTVDFSSKLAAKVNRLNELKYAYQLKKLTVVPPKQTILFGGLQRITQLQDSTYKDIDLTLFKNQLHEVSSAFLKGAKPMEPNGNTYPRVTVEEYIFTSKENAEMIFNMLKTSQKHSSIWMYISKAPHKLFLEDNRIYLMITGGHYMMGMENDIFEKIKK